VTGPFRTVAALYVEARGAYVGLDGVDPWDAARDARLYAGPHPVVAHPPCERWGRYWGGGPSHHKSGRFKLGDDGGCFTSALAAVRRFGGVLEHPEASHAWAAHGMLKPPRSGGWVAAGDGMGWTCCVEQGHYGHLARKATWLYAAHVELPSLRWGASGGKARLEDGFHSAAERRAARDAGVPPAKRIPSRMLAATPPEFRDLLLSIARSST
jgi:hypothetical protein